MPEGEGAAAAPVSREVLRIHIHEAFFTPSVVKPGAGPSEHADIFLGGGDVVLIQWEEHQEEVSGPLAMALV